jgi:hypothetical protein
MPKKALQTDLSKLSFLSHIFSVLKCSRIIVIEEEKGDVENVLSTDSVYDKFVGQNVKVLHHQCF